MQDVDRNKLFDYAKVVNFWKYCWRFNVLGALHEIKRNDFTWRPSVCRSACLLLSISNETFRLTLKKFGIAVLHQTLPSKRGCRENRLSDSYIFLKGLNRFLLELSVFHHRYVKIRYPNVLLKALNNLEYCEKLAQWKLHIYLRAWNKLSRKFVFCMFCPVGKKFGRGYVH